MNLAKKGILSSSKGPRGGFSVNERTQVTSVIEVVTITEGQNYFENCALRLLKCDALNPCPLHFQIVSARDRMKQLLEETAIEDLLKENKSEFLKSLTTFPAN